MDFNELYNRSRTTASQTDSSHKLNNTMEQSPSWEANSHSASHEISGILWNPKVHYRVHKRQLLIPILSQKNSVHTFTPYFCKIHSNIIPSRPRSSKWSLLFRFSNQNYICIFHLPIRATSPAHLILLHLITLPMFDDAHKTWSSSLFSVLQPHATYSSCNTLLSEQ